MASLGLKGPWDLTTEEIDRVVQKKSPGNYALGKVLADGNFEVHYVGRSDDDLNARLKDHVGKYPKFKASYASSTGAVFLKECKNYHDFKPAGNDIHPDRCNGSNDLCPHCDHFKTAPKTKES